MTSAGHARTTRNVVLIEATPMEVYRAFLDPEAVAAWMAPEGMTAHVHHFDPREGGRFRISLRYPHPGDGKTAPDVDTYHGHFVELLPDRRVVEAIEFESADPAFAGEMRMTARLDPTRQGTYLTLTFDDIPAGIALADNEAGVASSLARLSALVGRTTC